ncbi:MAG: hypothetical protein ACRDZQ_02895 [Acidimicrobiales bacterium]
MIEAIEELLGDLTISEQGRWVYEATELLPRGLVRRCRAPGRDRGDPGRVMTATGTHQGETDAIWAQDCARMGAVAHRFHLAQVAKDPELGAELAAALASAEKATDLGSWLVRTMTEGPLPEPATLARAWQGAELARSVTAQRSAWEPGWERMTPRALWSSLWPPKWWPSGRAGSRGDARAPGPAFPRRPVVPGRRRPRRLGRCATMGLRTRRPSG